MLKKIPDVVSEWFEKDENNITDWNTNGNAANFKTRFLLGMLTDYKKNKWNQELESLQKTGTIGEYERKFKELLEKTDTKTENEKVRLFLKGLDNETRKAVRFMIPTDLNDAVRKSKQVELAQMEEEKLNNGFNMNEVVKQVRQQVLKKMNEDSSQIPQYITNELNQDSQQHQLPKNVVVYLRDDRYEGMRLRLAWGQNLPTELEGLNRRFE